MLFTFPSSITLPSIGSITCSGVTGFSKTPSCSVSTSTTIKVTFSSGTINTSTFPLYVISFSNIVNPGSAMTLTNLQVATYSGSTVLDSTSTGSVSFTAKTLATSAASISTVSTQAGIYTSFSISVKIATAVQSTGQVQITFPKWEQRSLGQSNPGSMVDQITSSCTLGGDLSGNAVCTSTVSPSGTGTSDIVTVTGLFTSSGGLSSGKTIKITISNVRNPPTLKPYSGYGIATTDSSGNHIESCSGISLTMATVGTLSSDSVVRIIQSQTVNALGTYMLIIVTTNPIPIGGWIRVIIPTEVTVQGTPSYQALVPALSSSATLTLTGTTLDIKNSVTSYVNAADSISFTLSNIQNPTSVKPTSSYQVFTFDESNYGIDSRTTSLTTSATTGALTSVSIKPINITGVLQYAKNYTITFTLGNPLDTTGGFTVTFDSTSMGYSVNSRTCYIYYSNFVLNSAYSCKADSSTNTIAISGFLSGTISKNTMLNMTVGNLYIRNPPTSKASPASTMYTTLGGYQVDTGTAAQIYHNYTTMTSITVTADSYQTNKEGVSYTFYINPPSFLITTSWLIITLPSEVTIYDQTQITGYCGKTTLTGFYNSTQLGCSVTNSGSNITITGIFSKQVSDDPPSLAINIPGLRNPRSTEMTSGFNISFADGSIYYPTYISYNSPKIQMASTSTVKQVIISRASSTNGVTTNYTFTLSVSNTIQTGDYFIIQTPSDGPIFSSGSVCYSEGSFFTSKGLSYSYQSAYQMKISITSKSLRYLTTTLSSTLSFLISQVKNPQSTKPSSSLTINQFSSSGYQVESVSSGITVINDTPYLLSTSQFQVSLANYQVNVSTSYTFTFNPTNYQQGMILKIVFPPEVTLPQNASTIKCEAVQGTNYDLTCSLNVTNRTLSIFNAFPFPSQPSIISFAATPITNPPEIIQTSSFAIYSYSSDYYALDARNTSLLLDFSCQLPCRTCVITNITGCSSCYNALTGNASLTNLPFLYERYCYDSCPISTYQDLSTYQCNDCYSKRCKTCTGPNQRQCTSCIDGSVLINGNCVQYINTDYIMPFFIASVLWMGLVFIIMISCKRNQTYFIPSCTAGISILEWLHLFLQIGIFNYYGFTYNQYISTIVLIINLIINFYFLLIYLIVFSKNIAFRDHKYNHKCQQISNVIFSTILSSRLFKFLYSHLNDKQSLQIRSIITNLRVKKYYQSIHFLSMLTSIVSLGNGAYNLYLSLYIDLKFLILLDIEIVGISLIILVLLIIEFIPGCRERPECIKRMFNEEEPKPRLKYIDEQYNELANASAMSMYDGEQEKSEPKDKNLRLEVMKNLLHNLRQIKPYRLEQKLQEMINKEEGILEPIILDNHKRRKSDPAPFSKDNKKSHHYQNYKISDNTMNKNNMTTEIGLLDRSKDNIDSEEEDDEREIYSYPLTPNRGKKYQEDHDQETRNINDLFNLRQARDNHTFRQDIPITEEEKQISPIISPKQQSIQKRDQEVHMSQDLQMLNELEKLEKEKEEILRLNEELKQQRLQLERERAEIDRMREEGSKSARGFREDKNQLEGIEQQDYLSQTAKQNRRFSKLNKTNLDAVRETETEDLVNNKQNQKSRNSNARMSKTGKKLSNRLSAKSNTSMIDAKSHRCHGQSHQTRESVFKLRQKSPSRSSSLADILNSPSRNQLQNALSQKSQVALSNKKLSKTNIRETTKKNGTKIYYSDKSESSIEDLMDETPTTYNLANGRLDGQSMGYRFGKNILNKGSSPDKIDIFNEQQRRINELNSMEGGSSKKQSPRIIKKKFRQDPDSEEDRLNTYNMTQNNSTSLFIEGSLAGAGEDITFMPKNGMKAKKFSRDLTKFNNISNLINEPFDQNNSNRMTHSAMEIIDNSIQSIPHVKHSFTRNQQLSYQTQNITGLIYGNEEGRSKTREMSTTNKESKNSFGGMNSSKAFSKDRIKALEVAYLTKLVPNKSPPRSSSTLMNFNSANQQNVTTGGTQRIRIPNRVNNHTPDITSKLTGMQILNPPQINNYHQ